LAQPIVIRNRQQPDGKNDCAGAEPLYLGFIERHIQLWRLLTQGFSSKELDMARHGSAPAQSRPELSSSERSPVGIVKDWVAQKKLIQKNDAAKIANLRALREAAKAAEPIKPATVRKKASRAE
jgi:hypothetical protein